jgi:GTPase Era involved in 16S rRNA processing
MYSVVDFANYGELKFWARLVEGINAKVIVLANKIDDRYSFQKRDQEISAGRVLAEKKGYMFLEMSALTGENIERLLDIILKGKLPYIQIWRRNSHTLMLCRSRTSPLVYWIDNKRLECADAPLCDYCFIM